ncbi:sigma-70 family RNA polymerase sigma factor [Catenovulum agarivorans]|uniref:sigma-70 family RNA polymerase sigma factor n=1 Tax=Catenovulum agarivorans TaxID=1172192 RepID=UPI000314C6CE
MSAISRMFLQYNAFLKNYMRKFLKAENDIDDLVQDVYVKALAAEQGGKIQQPRAYLFRIAKNMALDEMVKKSRVMTSYLEECADITAEEITESMESEEEAAEYIRLYCEAMELLPKKTREIFMLRKIYGYKHKDIASKLGISISSVEKHIKSAGLFCQKYGETGQPAKSGDSQ